MGVRVVFLLTLFVFSHLLTVTSITPPRIVPLPSLREQAKEQQQWLDERIGPILTSLFREYNVSLWLLMMQEYAEDTVFWSLSSPILFAARRTTVILLYPDPANPEGLLVETYANMIGSGLMKDVVAAVKRINPPTITINSDQYFAWADGLHSGKKELLFAELGQEFSKRVVYQPELAVYYVALRTQSMLLRYQEMMETVHAIIAEAFSSFTIIPDQTTTDDLEWWFRDKVQSLGMTVWFQPNVEAVSYGRDYHTGVIRHGDLLWCDFGIVAMGLKTDTQHLAYVLQPGQHDAPTGLKLGLQKANRLQDILLENLKVGLSGNVILLNSLEQMQKENINGTIYSHPIGDWGHSAGPLIGLWDVQTSIPTYGDLKVRKNTWFSVELQATSTVPEWDNQPVSFRQEEDIFIADDGLPHWVYRRQTELYLI